MFDYLLEEALQRVAARDVRLLEAASLFSSFSIDMAADIGARPEFEVDSLLTDLHRRRFFVEVYGGEKPQYRFHPLFRRSLVDACRRRGSAEAFRQLQMNAARISLAAGQIDEAAQLMIESKDHKTLSTMCIEHGARLLQAGRHQDLARWIRHIPSQTRARDPWLSFWYASAQLPTMPL
ncbi:MAG: hypothetical protein GY935_26490 [Gammaproteobacteria bacterium]|nr:hypothetical protein [Gammaproteobacteria bacterium]